MSAVFSIWSSLLSGHGISGSVCLQLKPSAEVTTGVKGCVPAILPVLSRLYDAIVSALQAVICCKATGEE